jgi:hypothetical protein
MTNEQIAIKQWLSKPEPYFGACGCLGPRDGEPFCRCRMKMVEKVDSKWYLITEHRSPEGITHTAELVVTEEEKKAKYESLTYKEKLMVKYGRMTL